MAASLRLPAGASAKLLLSDAFSSNSVQLLQLDEPLLQEALRTGLVLKGASDEEAVLCTATRTFAVKQVETSNTLLLIPPLARGLADLSYFPDLSYLLASPQGDEYATHDALAPMAADDGGAASSEQHEVTHAPIVAACAAASHLELVEVAPPAFAVRAALATCPYDDAASDAGEASASFGRTWPDLASSFRCSDAQLLSLLASLGALHLRGRHALVSPPLSRRILEFALLTAAAEGWPLSSVPHRALLDALTADGFERVVAAHALAPFFRAPPPPPPPPAPGDAASAPAGAVPAAADEADTAAVAAAATRATGVQHVYLHAPSVGAEIGSALLDATPKWARADAFEAAWAAALPAEARPPQRSWLRGRALFLSPPGGGGGGGAGCSVLRLHAEELPPVPKDRFEALFELQERWTSDELAPWLAPAHVEEFGATMEGLLLAWCRCTQARPSDPRVYSARSKC